MTTKSTDHQCFICLKAVETGATMRLSGVEVAGQIMKIAVCHNCMEVDFPGSPCLCRACDAKRSFVAERNKVMRMDIKAFADYLESGQSLGSLGQVIAKNLTATEKQASEWQQHCRLKNEVDGR